MQQAEPLDIVKFFEHAFLWVAYLHAVGEAKELALLLMHKDNAMGVPHLSDQNRGALEAAVARWPSQLTQHLCEALGQAVLITLNFPLPETAALLKAPDFCKELKRLDLGERTIVKPTEDALISMHSMLANKSQALDKLRPLIEAHDQHLLHLELMERRLERLDRL